MRSLRLSGAIAGIQTPTPDEINDALHELNGIVSGYALESFWAASQQVIDFTPVAAAFVYTIGPGTTPTSISNATPDIIEQIAFLDAGIWYNATKNGFLNLNTANVINTSPGRPTQFAYQKQSVDVGNIYFDRTLDKLYTMKITINAIIPAYILTDVITLPLAYSSCLEYSLASILAVLYGKPDVNISSIANTRLERLKMFNVKIPDLEYDAITGGGIYDIYTDEFIRRGA